MGPEHCERRSESGGTGMLDASVWLCPDYGLSCTEGREQVVEARQGFCAMLVLHTCAQATPQQQRSESASERTACCSFQGTRQVRHLRVHRVQVVVTRDTTLVLNAERANEPFVKSFVEELQRKLSNAASLYDAELVRLHDAAEHMMTQDMSVTSRDRRQEEAAAAMASSARAAQESEIPYELQVCAAIEYPALHIVRQVLARGPAPCAWGLAHCGCTPP
jgi:hypothetical protein